MFASLNLSQFLRTFEVLVRKETTQYKLSPWIKPREMKKELYMKDTSNLIYVQNSDNVSGDVNDNLLLL